jgi:hypothetical protein
MRWISPKTGARSAGAILVLGLTAVGCREQNAYRTENSYAQPLDAVQDPGAHVQATSELSTQMLELSPADRRASFHYYLRSNGKNCNIVLSTVLKAGDNGTDLWRVGCADGAWLITISTESISFENCKDARTSFCTDRLKDILWNRG